MFLFFKKKFFFIFIFLLPLLISCSSQKRKNLSHDFSNNYFHSQSINLTNLRINLYNADKKLTPKLIRKDDGSSFYSYIKKPSDGEISLDEIKERFLLGPDYYRNDRDEVINLLKRINELKINNKLEYIDSGALGLWIPSEVIHVAQSCFGGSRIKTPQRIGLPLEYSKNLNINLDHKMYSKKSDEVINLEREAFTYSKEKGIAIKLLNDFCK